MRSLAVLTGLASCIAGCAAVSPRSTNVTGAAASTEEAEELEPAEEPLPAFDPMAFIIAYSRPRVAMLGTSSDDAAELDRQITRARSPAARRHLARASVIAHLSAALAASDETAREPQRRAMQRASRIAARGTRDAHVLAELAFADVYLAYVTNAPDRWRKADSFFMRHVVDRELLRIVTMMRGEIVLEQGDTGRAVSIFSLLRGEPSDPLTAYALYRIATSHCRSERADACRLFLEVTRRSACGPDAPEEAQEFGARAFTELGLPPIPRRERPFGGPRYCRRTDTEAVDPLFAP